MATQTVKNRIAPLLNGDAQAVTERRTQIELPKLEVRTAKIKIVGDSPYVSHNWDEKSQKMMLDKQMGKAVGKKAPKDPFQDFAASLYWMGEVPKKITQKHIDKGKFGIPAIAFKKAAVDGCSFVEGVTKVEARGAFFVVGDKVEIIGPPPKMRQDMVRVGMGTSDIRFRGEFFPWEVQLHIRYNNAVLSLEQIVHLFSVAGFSVGVGENRPQKSGQWGQFHPA